MKSLTLTAAAICAALIITQSAPASGAISTRGLDPRLKSQLYKIKKRCAGFRVVSAIRNTRTPRGRRSLHATGKAVDFRVNNYSCAYRVLVAWNYGMSSDGRRCRHIHISVPGHFRERKGFRHVRC